MKTRKKKPVKKRRSRMQILILSVFALAFSGYLVSRLFIQPYNTQLSAANQDLLSDIDDASASITRLEDEVAKLEEKKRVLGILGGQVSDNDGNVYYYDAN